MRESFLRNSRTRDVGRAVEKDERERSTNLLLGAREFEFLHNFLRVISLLVGHEFEYTDAVTNVAKCEERRVNISEWFWSLTKRFKLFNPGKLLKCLPNSSNVMVEGRFLTYS